MSESALVPQPPEFRVPPPMCLRGPQAPATLTHPLLGQVSQRQPGGASAPACSPQLCPCLSSWPTGATETPGVPAMPSPGAQGEVRLSRDRAMNQLGWSPAPMAAPPPQAQPASPSHLRAPGYGAPAPGPPGSPHLLPHSLLPLPLRRTSGDIAPGRSMSVRVRACARAHTRVRAPA